MHENTKNIIIIIETDMPLTICAHTYTPIYTSVCQITQSNKWLKVILSIIQKVTAHTRMLVNENDLWGFDKDISAWRSIKNEIKLY